ncbi:MAG: sulfopyruvate decarboxylase subunit beta [Candidatus Rokubacteria bacterium]|nr:sulfopyruvate decarboxylase subunit beta [Candidatus Rokubacteria bacterium]MBI4593651.1 sulfopyruvate decarboxylase subunit beta [Candidatus Rokubacteria bacterium]
MSAPLTRAAATRLLAERLTTEVVVTNLGQASLDFQQIADRPLNCYTYGAMGQCSSIALGIALARPDVRVVGVDGDGSLLMNLGSLCTIATEAPKNYALLIWDNEVHQTTGGQPTATAARSSLAAIARGAGVDKALEVRTEEELRSAYDRVLREDGPFVVSVKVATGRSEGALDRDVVGYARRFKRALAEMPAR